MVSFEAVPGLAKSLANSPNLESKNLAWICWILGVDRSRGWAVEDDSHSLSGKRAGDDKADAFGGSGNENEGGAELEVHKNSRCRWLEIFPANACSGL